MAVIITDMDLPKCCGDCPLLKSGYGHCELGIKIAFLSEKANDCPLKSTDEMIAEIRECAYDEPEGYVCFCYREPDKIVSLEDVEEIIHKYCDKEQNNDGQDG